MQMNRLLPQPKSIIRNPDGSSLFGGAVDASDFTDGELPNDLAGVTLVADGIVIDPHVGSFLSDDVGDQRVFHAFDQQRERWIDRWSKKSVFEARFDQAVGQVQLDVIGLGEVNYGRLEAYDAAGQVLTRVTSDAIAAGQVVTLTVTDPLGRIASIRALGHNDTSVALNNLRFGFEGTVTTNESGSLQFQNLPDGEYLVDLVPERLIHQFNQSSVTVQVSSGASDLIVASAQRINSPRYNELLPEDANQDGVVTAGRRVGHYQRSGSTRFTCFAGIGDDRIRNRRQQRWRDLRARCVTGDQPDGTGARWKWWVWRI